MSKKRCKGIFLVLLAVSMQMVSAQVTTAGISGTLKDETGAILPGVSVTAKNLDTGIARTVITDDHGRYQLINLPLGNYQVEAELAGFQTAVRSGIRLTVGREAVVDFTMKLGEITEKLVVSGEAPLVDTTSSALGGLVDEKKIRDLPLNGRDITQLLFLEPGVTFARRGGSSASGGFGKRVSISGSRPQSVGWLLDGTDVQNSLKTGPATVSSAFLGVESVQEFKVVTNSMSAEFGTVAGGVMNAVTKSGTNEFHGSAFEFLRNDNLDARNFFDIDPSNPLKRSNPPEFKRNQFGFTAGGPVVRNRTFIFGSYEGLRENLTTTQISRVPTAAGRSGSIPGRPAIVVNSAVRPLLALYPLPNGREFGDGTGEFVAPDTQPTVEDYFSIRLDHNLTDRHSFFGRYTFDDGDRSSNDGILLLESSDRTRHQYLTLQEQSILSPRFLNTFRAGYNRSLDGNFYAEIRDASALRVIPVPFLAQFSVPTVATLGPGVTSPRSYILNMFEWADDVNFTSGAHSLKFGMIAKRYQLQVNEPTRAGGQWSFNSFEDFLVGRVNSLNAPLPGAEALRNLRQSLFGFYVQDSIKLRSTLTLNVGLRYEFITLPTEIDGKLANLRSALDPQTTVGPPTRNPSLGNVAPRLGLAWDPFGDGKTSIRVGAGIFHDQVLHNNWTLSLTKQPPFFVRGEVRSLPLEGSYQAMVQRPAIFEVTTIDFQLSTPALLQYNLTIQREVLPQTVVTLGYAGSRGTHNFRSGEANLALPEILPDGRKFWRAGLRRRNPAFEADRRTWSDGNSSYNSLQLSVNRRWNQGFQLQGSYTWSRSIDEGSQTFAAALGGNHQSIDPEDHRRNRGLSLFDVRNNFVFNYTWDIPWGRDLGGAAAQVLGGWQLAGIVSLSSGHPDTPSLSFNRSRNLNTRNRFEVPNLRSGANNNPVLGGPDRYFDVGAFELQPAGFLGDLGRNTLIGPGVANVDFSVTKNFHVPAISEEFRIQFRSEFFNLLNRANFGAPATGAVLLNTGAQNPGAGRITTTTTTSRQIQFGLKFLW